MIIAYFLSMPNIGSWNGKWTGEGNLYARVRKYTEKTFRKELLQSHYYNFGDGWASSVRGELIDFKKAAFLRKKTKGFYGYEWMIDEIERHGRILSIKERHERETRTNHY